MFTRYCVRCLKSRLFKPNLKSYYGIKSLGAYKCVDVGFSIQGRAGKSSNPTRSTLSCANDPHVVTSFDNCSYSCVNSSKKQDNLL